MWFVGRSRYGESRVAELVAGRFPPLTLRPAGPRLSSDPHNAVVIAHMFEFGPGSQAFH